jgi:hypothetical protein
VKLEFQSELWVFRTALLCPLVVYASLFILAFTTSAQIPQQAILPLHLLALISFLYLQIFVSKNLVSAETGKSASFSAYLGTSLLIWFWPIGVWFVQPRINRLFAHGPTASPLRPGSALGTS